MDLTYPEGHEKAGQALDKDMFYWTKWNGENFNFKFNLVKVTYLTVNSLDILLQVIPLQIIGFIKVVKRIKYYLKAFWEK